MSAAARRASSQSGVGSTSHLCGASSLAAVRAAARVSDTRRAIAVPIVGDGRQGGASHRLGVWTHHPPRGRARTRVVFACQHVSSQWLTAVTFTWRNSRFHTSTRVFAVGCASRRFGVADRKEGCRMRVKRPKVVSTRLTADEYAALDALAGGQPVGTWAREQLLAIRARRPIEETLVAEIAALRTIVVNLQFAFIRGEALSEEDVQKLIDRADRDKAPEGPRASGLDGEREPVMTHRWGRTDAAGIWPNRKPLWTLGVWLIAMASGLGVGAYRYQTTWTPLQRVYLSTYLRSALAQTAGRARPLPAARGHRPFESWRPSGLGRRGDAVHRER